jgi:transposase, IS5 family
LQLQATLARHRPLIAQILSQAERRVLQGAPVPAGEKIVSLFEPHADIIVKGGRGAQYGHKLNLTAGRSGLILDLVIEDGNPSDSERFLPMLDRHIAFYGRPPRQAAADGGSMPVSTTSAGPKPAASAIWPSTKRPASPSRTWSKAAGSTAS